MNELTEMKERIQKLNELIQGSDNVVFFGGAGVSTESGIPDFRSVDGLYHQKYDYPPETILSHTFYNEHPKEFFRFYYEKILLPGRAARPNKAHRKLAEWEQQGKLKAVITQNIDGLHQAAGSHNVLELHGSVLRNECLSCGREYPLSLVLETDGVPHCPACGGIIRPDVVLYGEGLDMRILTQAVNAIRVADVLLVGGTSLTVYPAAALPDEFTGKHLVIINRTPTPLDRRAELVIRDPIQSVLPAAIGLSAD